jgi:glycosyltransferase involved in cell wall biosynthesis
VSDVHSHLRAADVFLLPSRAEGLSNALLEAMACGLACVATPASGSAGLLADGRGLLIPAGATELWADALRRLAADADLRGRLGEEARAHVVAHYSLAATADRLVAAYTRLRYGGARSRP